MKNACKILSIYQINMNVPDKAAGFDGFRAETLNNSKINFLDILKTVIKFIYLYSNLSKILEKLLKLRPVRLLRFP